MIWGRTNVNSSVQPTGQVNTSVGEVEGGGPVQGGGRIQRTTMCNFNTVFLFFFFVHAKVRQEKTSSVQIRD